MNIPVPTLDQFAIEELGTTPRVESPHAEVSFKVDVEPCRAPRRFVVGILDEETRGRGIAVSVYPATGEVCDLSNGGGVIGYLGQAPVPAGAPLACDLTIYRFGKNFVCSVRIAGEIFLYPAFSLSGDTRLTAFVGTEQDSGDGGVKWSRLRLDVLDQPVAA